MKSMPTYIRIGDRLLSVSRPLVMAIINVTPDSFFSASRAQSETDLCAAFERTVREGADIIDIGACSTRPAVQAGASGLVDEGEEWRRLQMALSLAREMRISLPISVDTFRPAVAKRAMEEFGVEMINDISGNVYSFIRVNEGLKAAYVLTYNRANDADKTGDLLSDALAFFSRRVDELHRAGVSDVIIDPGFGFGQTVQESLSLLGSLSALKHLECPILAGISRKRMAYEPDGLTPETCLEQTLRLERLAVEQGANILRVHDVAATKQMIDQLVNSK